jgi:MFS family permease
MLMVVFLFRRGLGNCIKPLLDSVVADFTPSTERGMWNAFLSIGIAGWSGSALLGGILADQHGYTFVIFITSVVYAGSLLLLMALVGLVRDQTDKCPTDPVEAASEDSEPSDAEGSEEVP